VLVAVTSPRTALVAGFLAGGCVFLAPLVVLAAGLLMAYAAYVAGDATGRAFSLGRAIDASDFRAVFAPAVNEAPALALCGAGGAALALLRRWLTRHTDAQRLASGGRSLIPELVAIYVAILLGGVAYLASRGASQQVQRFTGAVPVSLLLVLFAAWVAHTVWQYCFRNLVELLASDDERQAARALQRRTLPPKR
jgi:hypothetical protein